MSENRCKKGGAQTSCNLFALYVMTFDQNAMCYQFHSIENQKRALNSNYRMTLYVIDTYPLEYVVFYSGTVSRFFYIAR